MSIVRVMDWGVWSNRLVLSVDQNPQSEFPLGYFEVLGNTLLECEECLGLENTECGKLGCGQVFIVEGRQIEALMT